MALQILECNEVFHVDGKINTTTSNAFLTHFSVLLKKYDEVVVNIDKVKEIDRSGVDALKKLQEKATENKKEFVVIGYGCKDIYYEFTYHKSA